MNKIKIFIFLNRKTKLLFFETLLFLGWARILKMIPFSKIAPKLGEQMIETCFNNTEKDKKVLAQISQMIQITSKYTFWESQCLVKALAAMKMLERRNIDSTLYLGTAKDENGKLIAHAWLRSGPFYITGSEEKNRFIVVSKFAKKMSSY